MRVIVANYRFFVAGGPEKYMFKFMEAAEKRGIEVIPFSVNNPQNVPCQYEKYFAKPRSKQLLYADTKKSLSNYWGMLRATVWNYDAERRLRKLIRDTHPDIVYILHEINHLSPSIIRAAKKENVKVIHRISDFFMFCAKYDFLLGNDICESCIHGDYSKAIQNRCVKGSYFGTRLRVLAMKLYTKTRVFDDVDIFIATCSFSRNKLISGGVPPEKIVCVPTFIDEKAIDPCYENDKYFLFLGRMAHQKGTIYAVKAMNELRDSGYKLKITGEISSLQYDQEIWKYIVDNRLQDIVEFTGFKSGTDLTRLIERATCIVCPAIWYENMPNTVLESYAYGKPVVASRLGSLADIVIDGYTGFLFEPKNVNEFAEKLDEFIKNPKLAETLGRNARATCEKEYTENIHMDRIEELFRA